MPGQRDREVGLSLVGGRDATRCEALVAPADAAVEPEPQARRVEQEGHFQSEAHLEAGAGGEGAPLGLLPRESELETDRIDREIEPRPSRLVALQPPVEKQG